MLRLPILVLFATAAVFCYAFHSLKQPIQPAWSNECAALGEISREEFEAAFPNTAFHAASVPTVTNGRASCSDATPYFHYVNKDEWIMFATGIQCTAGYWFVDSLDGREPTPLKTTKVRCTN